MNSDPQNIWPSTSRRPDTQTKHIKKEMNRDIPKITTDVHRYDDSLSSTKLLINDALRINGKCIVTLTKQIHLLLASRGKGNTSELLKTSALIVTPSEQSGKETLRIGGVSKDMGVGRVINMNSDDYNTTGFDNKPIVYDNHAVQVIVSISKNAIETSERALKAAKDELTDRDRRIFELESELDAAKNVIGQAMGILKTQQSKLFVSKKTVAETLNFLERAIRRKNN